MIHFLPDSSAEPVPAPYAEAIARLADLRQALSLVDPAAAPAAPCLAGPPPPGAAARCFDSWSERTVAAASAGIETVLALRAAGREPNRAAMRAIADEIRSGLSGLERLLPR